MVCKLCRIIEESENLSDLNSEILSSLRSKGYRSVTEDIVNKRIFEHLLGEMGQLPPPEEVELAYSIIKYERKHRNISDVAHNELMKFLSKHNLPLSRLKKEFISHTTLRNHVINCLEVRSRIRKSGSSEYFEKRKNGIEYGLKIIKREVERLMEKNLISSGFQLRISLVCGKCGKEIPLESISMNNINCCE